MTIKALKSLGQNFLFDQNIIKKIINSAKLDKKDVVLEIGPGTGSLTQELARQCKKVIAVEKDQRLIKTLENNLAGFKNIVLVNQDILKYQIKEKNYKIVASLPYYLANFIIRKFLESNNPPSKMVLVVQKEVAQRICSQPPKMNLLGVSVQSLSKPKILFYISKGSFSPTPKVDGAVLEILPEKKEINYDLFFQIVKAGFSQPRKQLANNFKNMLKLDKMITNNWLEQNKIDFQQRPGTLQVNDWFHLTNSFPL